jgi:hypothetical protein
MPTFGTAAYPTSGTVITRAYAVANLVDPINWLRALTGGGDPPAADRVIVSTSTTATNWAQITTAVLADANVTDVKLALQKVQAATPLATSFGGLLGANKNGFYLMGSPGDAPVAGHSYYAINIVDFTNPTTYNCQLAVDNADPTQMYIRLIIAGSGTAWHKVWNDGNDGSSSGLDAGLLEGHAASFFATATGLAAVNQVPSGLIAGFRNAADLTAAGAGWVAETNLDGRIMVGSGTAGGQTFVPANSYGTSWTATTSGTAAATTGGGAVQGGGSSSADPQGHTHVTSGTVSLIPVMRAVAMGRKL